MLLVHLFGSRIIAFGFQSNMKERTMGKITFALICLSLLLPINKIGLAQSGSGDPVKYISSCEIDLNADDQPDVALLIETIKGRELIVLLRADSSYTAYLVKKDIPQNMFLSSHFGKELKETIAGEGKNKKPKTYKTQGTYLLLYFPEGPSYGYFWDGTKFQEVWTAD